MRSARSLHKPMSNAAITARRAVFEAIGTRWDIRADDPIDDTAWQRLSEKIRRRIEAFDKAYSRFRPDSLVTKMSRRAGRYELPADGYKLLSFYERLYKSTDGKITPLIGQTITDAGYDAKYSFQTSELHTPPKWEDVITYDQQEIYIKKPALLDFSAAGKGYIVDIVGELLRSAGLHSFIINAGGDLLHCSVDGEPISVGLENPSDTLEAIGIAKLSNQSLCASSGSKRKWGTYHHIIDPDSLQSPIEIISTWVVADDTMMADGIATALFFTNPEVLRKHFNFSYAILYKDMTLLQSKDFPATVFKA